MPLRRVTSRYFGITCVVACGLAAASAGQSFRAYCWAAEGENYWLTSSAKRFGGLEFEVSASDYLLGAHLGGVSDGASWTVAVPELAEVEEFIRSEEWVDMLKITRRRFFSPQGLGLKVVAPWPGFGGGMRRSMGKPR